MSNEIIERLHRESALDAVPDPALHDAYYVPFEALGLAPIETTLREAVESPQRIALIGPSGCGKTMLVAHVLTRESPRPFGYVRVPLVAEDDRTLTEVAGFAQHVVRQVARYAQATSAAPRQVERELATSIDPVPVARRVERIGARLPWIGIDLGADLSAESARVLQDTSTADLTRGVDRLLELIRLSGVTPVVWLDDTDSALRRADGIRVDIAAFFFDRVVRWLAERSAGVVVTVHPQYLDVAEYHACLEDGFLDRPLRVPTLTDAGQLARIIDRRVETCSGARVGDVFTDDAVGVVFEAYRERHSIRRALQLAKFAVDTAHMDGAERIEAERVRAARLELA